MDDFEKLNLPALIDLLAMQTNEYMRLLRDGSSDEEYDNCKRFINQLTAEIERRKQKEMKDAKSGVTGAG